jgi:hypothetical protein
MKSLRDQIIGDWRRKSAADADRPRVFRKQPVTTHRCRQQRADAIGERDQRRLGIRKHGAATAENERALRVRQRLGEAFNGPGIGVQAAGRRRQLQWREVRGDGHQFLQVSFTFRFRLTLGLYQELCRVDSAFGPGVHVPQLLLP